MKKSKSSLKNYSTGDFSCDVKITKRKAKRIANRPSKKKVIDRNIYAGSEEALLNKVEEIIVKIIKKEIGL